MQLQWLTLLLLLLLLLLLKLQLLLLLLLLLLRFAGCCWHQRPWRCAMNLLQPWLKLRALLLRWLR